jgi:type IV secretory pathway ATPase VirB11/archaellum biosynthesis ATPase
LKPDDGGTDAMRPFDGSEDADCRCVTSFEDETGAAGSDGALVVEASGCPDGGDLATGPGCRETVVRALADREADAVRTRCDGFERAYTGAGATLLLAAGRFVDRAAFHDDALAARAARDPLGAAREATGRAGPVARIAAETGLGECAANAADYADAFSPRVGPTVAGTRIDPSPPRTATLRERRELDTGATVRVYDRPGGAQYHLTPVEHALDDGARATLAAARDRLAAGAVDGGERAPGRAVRSVAGADDPVETLAAVLRKHTTGPGVLRDLFADPTVTDAFATAPVAANPLRVVADDERLTTNVRLTPAGAEALASRLRRRSGRSFSRANPTVDATLPVGEGRVRVAGVADPASDGLGYAFRSRSREAWTLPALVGNDTLTSEAAALLSVAVERAAAVLVAGPRGAGKTTLLGALLWEIPRPTRTVAIEDTPELPVAVLRDAGRDVQPLRTASVDGDGPAIDPDEALRTALRLGEGALVVGEVRGEEARTLYEAMRVGARGSAVLGTIHGDGARAVRERVVSDLGVPESSFAATDLIVALDPPPSRRVAAVQEVRRTDAGTGFEALHRLDDGRLRATDVIDRGNSRLVGSLADSSESYADVRAAVEGRATLLDRLAATGRTNPADLVEAYGDRGDAE